MRPALRRNALSSSTLLFAVFCCVSGGPFGLEPLVAEAGPGFAILLVLALPLLWAVPDGLITAELASAIPEEGGYVVWVRRAMGPFAAFLNAWWTWIYTVVDATIYPVLFTSYLMALLPALGVAAPPESWRWPIALAVICAFTGLNIRGTRLVGEASRLFTFLIVLPFLAMALIAALRWGSAPFTLPFLAEGKSVGGALSAGLGIAMWNYLGWDQLSTVAAEVDEPAKAYPRAILLGIPLVAGLYLLALVVGLRFVPDAALWTDDSWPAIAQAVGGRWLGLTMSAAALVSCVALFTASLLGASRVPYVLAEDGYLPRGLVAIHPKYGTPWKAILLCGAVYAVLATKRFQELVQINVLLYASALALEALALIVLRLKEPHLARPFRVRGGLLVAGAVVALPILLAGALAVLQVREEGWPSLWMAGVAIMSGPLVFGSIRLFRGGARGS